MTKKLKTLQLSAQFFFHFSQLNSRVVFHRIRSFLGFFFLTNWKSVARVVNKSFEKNDHVRLTAELHERDDPYPHLTASIYFVPEYKISK